MLFSCKDLYLCALSVLLYGMIKYDQAFFNFFLFNLADICHLCALEDGKPNGYVPVKM